MNKLRSYQHEQLLEVHEKIQNGDNYIIVQSPTGSGKNFMMAYICSQLMSRDATGLFTVAGRSIVSQFTSSLDMFNVPWTYMMSGKPYHPHMKFSVSSIDTLNSWYFKPTSKKDIEELPSPDYVFGDECRLLCTETRGGILKHFGDQGSIVLGFDATPKAARIHLVFDSIVHGRSTPWHIGEGNLSEVMHYSPSQADEAFIEQLKEVKVNGGEYSSKELEGLMDKNVLVGEIVSNYETISMSEYGEFKPFVIACVNKKHARSVEDAFLSSDHKVEYIDADTDIDERVDMFQRVRDGETLGIVSVLTMAYGVDIPNLCIGINARPSKSINLFLQFGGRILRICDGKSHAVFIDHAGAISEHGYLDDEYVFSLDPDAPVENKTKEERKEKDDLSEVDITCTNCTFVYKNSPICPKCGHENIIDLDQHNVVYVNSDLVKAERDRLSNVQEQHDKLQWIRNMKDAVWRNPSFVNDSVRVNELNSICHKKFKEYYDPTSLLQLEAGKSDEETKRYLRFLNIRRAKGSAKHRRK